MNHQVLIIGSGPIAFSAALLFKKYRIDVALIMDKNKLNTKKQGPARLFAISHHSHLLLSHFIDFSNISQNINHIRVVDDNSLAKVDFAPGDIDLENFGCMIDESVLIDLLYSKLQKSNIKIYDSAGNIEIKPGEFSNEVIYDDGCIITPLVVAADGKYSSIRKKLSIETEEHDYDQTAIVIDIRHSSWPHEGVAVEKFTPSGPFAILPKYEENGTTSSLVWVEKGKLDNLDCFNKDILKDLILRKLDGYLGDIELISEPMIHQLKLIQSCKRFFGRVIFAGDAAQAIHPIAGQGFNLGLRDVIELVKMVHLSVDIGLDYGDDRSLNAYCKRRKTDVEKMILSTTLLNSLFANDILPVKIARRVGLTIFDKIDLLKKESMKYASGL